MKQVSPRPDLCGGGGFPVSAISCVGFKQFHAFAEQEGDVVLENKNIPNLTAVHQPNVCGLMTGRVQLVLMAVKEACDGRTRWASALREAALLGDILRPTGRTGCPMGLADDLLRLRSRKWFSLKNHVNHGDTFVATKVFLMDSSVSVFIRITKPGSV